MRVVLKINTFSISLYRNAILLVRLDIRDNGDIGMSLDVFLQYSSLQSKYPISALMSSAILEILTKFMSILEI